MMATPAEVKEAIRSFASGSAGGKDGLRPQHLKDMTGDRVGGELIEALTDFVNLVLRGRVPEVVRPAIFGAQLFPFTKKMWTSDQLRWALRYVAWSRRSQTPASW